MAHSFGAKDGEDGVTGKSSKARGVVGQSVEQVGVIGVSDKFVGVWGESKAEKQSGVLGVSHHSVGVLGQSKGDAFPDEGVGVQGEGQTGVVGRSTVRGPQGGPGVRAQSFGSPAALIAENAGDFSAVLIFQDGSGAFIVCRAPQNRDVFRVLNSGEVHAVGDVKVRGSHLLAIGTPRRILPRSTRNRSLRS
jgi:hypothetical protein